MGRDYSRNHQLEDESRRKLSAIFSDWIVEDQDEDYGCDVVVRLTEVTEDGRREVTGTSFEVQLKASQEFAGDKEVGHSLDTELIQDQYLDSNLPVVLVLYDAATGELYWRVIQEYCWDVLESEKPDWREQSTVQIKASRTPLSDSLDEFRNEIRSTSRRIVLEKSRELDTEEGISTTAGSEELEVIRNDILTQYMRKTLATGEKYLEEGREKDALKCFAQVFELPQTDESRLKAGLRLLEEEELNEPETDSVVRRGYLLTRALALAQKYDYDEILKELSEESQLIKPYLRSELVGTRFENVEIGECFTVVAVEDYIPYDSGMLLIALQQYDDGTPWDENALAIIGNDGYQPLDETGPALQGACLEGSHEFEKDDLRRGSGSAFCKECGLSEDVLLDYANHEPPFVCERCDSVKEFDEFTEGHICKSCR